MGGRELHVVLASIPNAERALLIIICHSLHSIRTIFANIYDLYSMLSWFFSGLLFAGKDRHSLLCLLILFSLNKKNGLLAITIWLTKLAFVWFAHPYKFPLSELLWPENETIISSLGPQGAIFFKLNLSPNIGHIVG